MANDSAENEKNTPLTAGQRLAAQQAAKSARKAAERGRDADLVEEKAIAQAAVAKDWLQDNLKPLGLMAGAVLLVAAVGIGWSTFTHRQAATRAPSLPRSWRATRTTQRHLRTRTRRSQMRMRRPRRPHGRESVRAGRSTSRGSGNNRGRPTRRRSTAAMRKGSLGRRSKESRTRSRRRSPIEQAVERLEELRALDSSIAPIAGYHQGRILFAEGKLDEAKTKFEGVLNSLRQADAPLLPYTQEQAEARLALIDPSLAPATGVDPRRADEVIRQMNEMLQRQPPQE